MREVKKRKDKVAVALVLCFCVVALTSVFAVRSNLNKIGDDTKNVSNKTKVETESPAISETNVVDSKDTKKPTKAGSADFIAPLEGNIQMEYSMDMPIYSKTLDQYMTHSGIDIASSLSTRVNAVAGGTVTRVAEDDKFGVTVELKHKDGMVSIYSNLAKTELAELGDVVAQGDKIGVVGETALFETLEEPHLHLEMTKNSAFVNPTDYIKGL